jgi:hypothetical protein
MNICFFCKRPVPGDWAVRISVGFWIDKDYCMGSHGPELCFHHQCAAEFALALLRRSLSGEPRTIGGGRRKRLRKQLEDLQVSWGSIEPDYAKPPKDWWHKEA